MYQWKIKFTLYYFIAYADCFNNIFLTKRKNAQKFYVQGPWYIKKPFGHHTQLLSVYYQIPPAFKINQIKINPSQNPPDQNQPESKSIRSKSTRIKIHPIKIHPIKINPTQNQTESKKTPSFIYLFLNQISFKYIPGQGINCTKTKMH